MMTQNKILDICGQFDLEGNNHFAKPYGNGHINSTFKVTSDQDKSSGYLLQRINHNVFKDINALMSNIGQVTEHIRKKITAVDEKHGHRCLRLIKTRDNALFYKDLEGQYWRMYVFLDGLHSYDIAPTADHVYEAAIGFGNFLNQLSDLPVEKTQVTIPDFHNVLFRLENLKIAVNKNFDNRLNFVGSELKFVKRAADTLSEIQKLSKQGKIPLRITHNDTKINNILMDGGGKAKCIIDLDTVMPGLVHYDFGDGIRTTVCNAPEDESDLSKIQLDMQRFEAFTDGYLNATRETLLPIEMEYLALSGPLFSFLMGIRFLTDYLEGDVYYKIDYQDQNLFRSKAQLDLTKKLLERIPDLERTIKLKSSHKSKT